MAQVYKTSDGKITTESPVLASRRLGTELSRNRRFITGETRALNGAYTDPLTLCFKFLVDYNKPYGLFAPVSNKDSALAFLKRIGEEGRAIVLEAWIEEFKDLNKYYDFLFQSVEGLDYIHNRKPHEEFGGEDSKINLLFRETIDMRVQSLITTYRYIWFDQIRRVEVLPINLRMFDCSVLVYSAGYFNMALYDFDETDEKNSGKQRPDDTFILPTLRKLSDEQFSAKTMSEFNHQIYLMKDCIINEESGKEFIGTVSNEMSSDFVKNNISISYRFANFSGRFNNLIGQFDIANLFAVMAARNRAGNESRAGEAGGSAGGSSDTNDQVVFNDMKEYRAYRKKQRIANTKKWLNDLKASTGDTLKGLGKDLTSRGKSLYQKEKEKLVGQNSAINDAWGKVSDPKLITNMVKSAEDLGFNLIENAANTQIAKLNNIVFQNFSGDLFETFKNMLHENPTNDAKLMTNPPKPVNKTTRNFEPGRTVTDIPKGIKYANINVYNRRGF